MASNIASRRTVRGTRPATIKDSENANARLRSTSRSAKPPSTSSVPSISTNTGSILPLASRATAPTAASRAKTALHAGQESSALDSTAVKRKREALGEVTHLASHNASKLIKPSLSQDRPEASLARAVYSRSSTTTTKASGKTRTTTSVRNGIQVAVDQIAYAEGNANQAPITVHPSHLEPSSDHAMAIDHPTSRTQFPSVSNKILAPKRQGSTSQESNHRPGTHQRITSRNLKAEEADYDEPASKKRRTSSVPPEDPGVDVIQKGAEPDLQNASELNDYAEAPMEADPEGDDWDDLDAEDADDPVMVSEYVVEIFKYLKVVEQSTMANATYMDNQKELAWKMRGILTDWLIQVHVRFRLLPETLFLAVNIIDRFLSTRVVSLAKLQLVGITCMFIAAKFEEIVAPSVMHFLQCADSSYNESEILQAEKYVLKTLNWNLSYPNPVHFLRRISKADDYDIKVRTLAKYLLEIGCLEWRLIPYPPSLLAAASVWLARMTLGKDEWTPNLAHYSSYAESSLLPVVNIMINYLLKPIRHESFFKKYAGKRFLKSSIFMREWVLDRWEENTQIRLEIELPTLRAQCRALKLQNSEADEGT
jgi:hypothetical protein